MAISQKIQLQHPAGKKAVKIDADKYETMQLAIIQVLKEKQSLTHNELLDAVKTYFVENKTIFTGSVSWYMESVKLDLEARNILIRTGEKAPHRYALK